MSLEFRNALFHIYMLKSFCVNSLQKNGSVTEVKPVGPHKKV